MLLKCPRREELVNLHLKWKREYPLRRSSSTREARKEKDPRVSSLHTRFGSARESDLRNEYELGERLGPRGG